MYRTRLIGEEMRGYSVYRSGLLRCSRGGGVGAYAIFCNRMKMWFWVWRVEEGRGCVRRGERGGEGGKAEGFVVWSDFVDFLGSGGMGRRRERSGDVKDGF